MDKFSGSLNLDSFIQLTFIFFLTTEIGGKAVAYCILTTFNQSNFKACVIGGTNIFVSAFCFIFISPISNYKSFSYLVFDCM